ncbi:MAG: hypothetical protein KTR16_01640 [Acidiferrobacterales bacterium]|nr:hypothetical protein [Acidiferrobacterales bacterium]
MTLAKQPNGYIQRSNMSPEAYDELRSRNKLWQKKSYPSKHGGQVKSARCMDFYRSDELHNLYLKHTPCDSKENWWDNQDYKKICL